MRHIFYGLSLIILLLPAAAHAQYAKELSLDEAINYALKHNVNAKNAQLDVLLQKAKNAEITALALPKISADGQYSDYLNPIQSFIPGEFFGGPKGSFQAVQFTPKYNVTASGSASQILFDGSVFVALQARNTVMELFEKQQQLTEENLRLAVQKAYYSLVIAGKQFNNLKRSLVYIRDMTSDMEAMRQQGFVEKIELDRTNVQLNNFVSDSIRIGSLLEISGQMLKYQMGMDIDEPIVLTDTSVEETVAETLGLINETTDYNARTEFSLLKTQLSLNEYDLKRYKLAAMPTLAAFASAGYNFSTNTFDDVFEFYNNYKFNSLWGLKLSVPIFKGLERTNQVKQAKLNVQKTKNNIDNIKLSIDFQTESAKTTLKNSALALENQKRNMELAESVLELARKKYKEGVGSNLEVSTAQTELLKAQSNYYQSMLDVMNAQADLQKALGLLK